MLVLSEMLLYNMKYKLCTKKKRLGTSLKNKKRTGRNALTIWNLSKVVLQVTQTPANFKKCMTHSIEGELFLTYCSHTGQDVINNDEQSHSALNKHSCSCSIVAYMVNSDKAVQTRVERWWCLP